MRMHTRTLGLLLVALSCGASVATAQSDLAAAERLYDDTMYTRALEVLDRLAITAPTATVHQFRALCLLALGRGDAAERAMADIVAADPFFTMDPDAASPSVIAQFAGVRRRLLPPQIRRGFAEATSLYRDGAKARANERFTEVLRLLDDPALQNDQSLTDLTLVASAFVELTRAQTAPPPPPPPLSVVVRPVIAAPGPASLVTEPPFERVGAASARFPVAAVTPDVTTPPAAVSTVTQAAAAAAPVAVSSPSEPVRVSATVPEPYEPAVAIVRPLPKWSPPDARSATRTFAGAITVDVDEHGRVVGTSSQRVIHPAYDPVVLAAARAWIYKPALLRGRPVRSEVTVEIELLPSTN
jgi:hypothetical protein